MQSGSIGMYCHTEMSNRFCYTEVYVLHLIYLLSLNIFPIITDMDRYSDIDNQYDFYNAFKAYFLKD